MELIDKTTIVEKIEKRIKETESMKPKFDQFWAGQISAFKGILKILDTLEVKEVDLENLFQALPEKITDEKSHQVYELSIYHYDGQCVVDYVGEIDNDSLYAFSGNTLYEAIEKAWSWLRENSTGG